MSDAPPILDAAELTRYIEKRYHARHREQLRGSGNRTLRRSPGMPR